MSFTRWISTAVAVLLVSGLATVDAQAQTPISFVAGPNFTTLYGDDADSDDFDSKTGFFFAAGTSFALSESVAFNPYLGFVQKGAKEPGGDEEFSMNYIEIPLFLNTGIPIGDGGAGLSLSAGPQLGFQISCDFAGNDCSDDDDLKKFELGAVVGAGVGFPAGENGQFIVGGGADFGLTTIFDDEDLKNKGFYLFVGYGTAIGG